MGMPENLLMRWKAPELVQYSETDLEKHIIDNLQQFLLEFFEIRSTAIPLALDDGLRLIRT